MLERKREGKNVSAWLFDSLMDRLEVEGDGVRETFSSETLLSGFDFGFGVVGHHHGNKTASPTIKTDSYTPPPSFWTNHPL